jgi:predicted amidophosphoribosyltransferase
MAAPRPRSDPGSVLRDRSFIRALADLVLPPACLACDGIIDPRDTARLVCRRCRSLLRAVPHPACTRCEAPRLVTSRSDEACAECRNWPDSLTVARSACLLLPPADVIVHALKYRGWPALASLIADRMATVRLPAAVRDAAVCVPVPTTRARLRTRGYNQAFLIAAAFASRTGRSTCDVLAREGHTGTQTALQPVARRANVAGAFRFVPERAGAVRDRAVLLIDDVLTTGATAAACAATLADAGALSIGLITFARAIDARRLTQSNGAMDDR